VMRRARHDHGAGGADRAGVGYAFWIAS
jgi:hypothetical protein